MASPDPLWTGLKGVTSFLPGPLDELLGDASPGDSRALHTVGCGLPPGGLLLPEGGGQPWQPLHPTSHRPRGGEGARKGLDPAFPGTKHISHPWKHFPAELRNTVILKSSQEKLWKQ